MFQDRRSAWAGLKADLGRQHGQFDQSCREWLGRYSDAGGRIWCARGCRGCCNLAVNATFSEALLAAEVLTAAQDASLGEHVERLRQMLPEAGDLKSYLRLHRRKVGFCPFLTEDGACGIYASRPFSCRSLLSTRNSDWCAVDFGDLHPLEKQAFLSGLDREVVAYPTHYVAATQGLGAQMEAEATRRMLETFGVALTGNFAVLVYLEKKHGLSRVVADGAGRVEELLAEAGMEHPFLVSLKVFPG
ncbi:zinc/iron-chelating domain-containing protein [Desulfuromonas versatilis]|uniref:Zinc/iron-chelating domain-containing protein n=1 Tax=Desulfuromonas versatilis TaxID=2802975 RepID=A0ABM8HW12_9BACT|nr:zinc/iron-chelating domain-containing protein [Desulfuromonas versatilis]